MARRFDPDSLELYGQEEILAAGVATSWFNGMAGISVSQSGTLAYTIDSYWRGQLRLYDRRGTLLKAFEPSGYYTNPSLSPDGSLVAVDKSDSMGELPDIFTFNLSRPGDYSRVTSFEGDDSNSLWSPDGEFLLFSRLRESARDLFRKNISGTEEVEPLHESGDDKYVSDCSRDGKLVLFTVRTKNPNPYDLWVMNLSDENKAEPYLNNMAFNEWWGQFSPDGKWVAYESNEAGREDIYVQSFPEPGNKQKISKKGGTQPKWIGGEIFYLAPDNKIMAVPVETSPNLVVGDPVELFGVQLFDRTRNNYDVTSDGRRFLVVGPAENRVASPIVVLNNWKSLLKK
ncbi:MAG: PD40 domain-containing protein [Acidobacteria bacterium]|nr:PD40 domain-containing protein [Acidobacteriota bacterium]